MSEQRLQSTPKSLIRIQRADSGDSGDQQIPITIQAVEQQQHMIIDSDQHMQDDVTHLINDPEFQRAVQEQVGVSGAGGDQTIYVQVTSGDGQVVNSPTTMVVQSQQHHQSQSPQIQHDQEQQVVVLMPSDDNQAKTTATQSTIRSVQQHYVPATSTTQKQIRPRQKAVRMDADIINPVNVTPISHRCLMCNGVSRTTLRNIKSNFIIQGLLSEVMTPAFPQTSENFKVCDICIGVMDKMKEMRDNMIANFKEVDEHFDLLIAPVTRMKQRDVDFGKRRRVEDDEVRTGEHEYHRSETTYNRAKKAIEISGLLTKQYLNIAPFNDEERLSIAGVINVAAPTELAARIMKCPALLNALKKLILLDTNHTCEKLCSTNQAPGPSVLRLKGVNTISEDDLVSEIIVEMRRCMPFVMDLLFTMCRPLHGARVECREMLAVMYAMGMYCRNPSLTAVRRININRVLTNRTLKPRANNRAK